MDIPSVLERWRRLCTSHPDNPTTPQAIWNVLLQLEQDMGVPRCCWLSPLSPLPPCACARVWHLIYSNFISVECERQVDGENLKALQTMIGKIRSHLSRVKPQVVGVLCFCYAVLYPKTFL